MKKAKQARERLGASLKVLPWDLFDEHNTELVSPLLKRHAEGGNKSSNRFSVRLNATRSMRKREALSTSCGRGCVKCPDVPVSDFPQAELNQPWVQVYLGVVKKWTDTTPASSRHTFRVRCQPTSPPRPRSSLTK